MAISKKLVRPLFDKGLHLIPLQSNKSPMPGWKWKDYVLDNLTSAVFENIPVPDENFLFDGVGLACGNGIEAIDFDTKYDSSGDLFERYCEAVESISEGLTKRVLIQRTVSGGVHFVYQCEEIEGNKKLARRPASEFELMDDFFNKVRVLIETRGEGGYIAIAPTPGYMHLNTYRFDSIPVITVEERQILLTVARTFDSMPLEEHYDKSKVEKSSEWIGGVSPFDDFNSRGDCVSILESHGWQVSGESGENILLKRPGTKNRLSATFHRLKRVFYVFSSSTEFDQNRGYSPVAVYAKLLFNDNYSDAAKALLKEGYGEPGKKVELKNSDTKAIDPDNFIRLFESDEEDIQRWRRGEIIFGKSTGFESLDPYFLHKAGNVVIINGISQAGKTIWVLYVFMMMAKLYGFNFIIYSAENKTKSLRIKLMEYYLQASIKYADEEMYSAARSFVNDHFVFIDIDKLYSSFEMIDIMEKICNKKKIDIAFIDPYNSLVIPTLSRGLSAYNHHVETAGAFRVFCNRTNCSLWVNMHPFTEQTRQKDRDGFPLPPRAQDTENGALWWNRCDDFLTLHRLASHPDRWMYTDVYVRKIKEAETGGSITAEGEPVSFKLLPGGRIYDEVTELQANRSLFTDQSPIRNYYEPTSEQQEEGAPF